MKFAPGSTNGFAGGAGRPAVPPTIGAVVGVKLESWALLGKVATAKKTAKSTNRRESLANIVPSSCTALFGAADYV
jgi:hypothetical protein